MALTALDKYLSMGREARDKGDFPAAAGLYARALKLDSRSYQGWVGLAACYGGLNKPEACLEAASCAVKIAPSIPHAWQLLAEASLKKGDGAGARKLATRAAELNPRSQIPDYIEAKIAVFEGDRRGAAKRLRLTLAKDPGFAPAYSDLLELAAAAGDFRRMPGIAKEALVNCEDKDCMGIIARLCCLLVSGPASAPRLDAAAEFYETLGGVIKEKELNLPPGFPREMAVQQLKGGRLGEAEAGLSGFLDTLGPARGNTVEAFRANCCLGRYREAFETAEELLEKRRIGLVDLWSPWFSNRIAPSSFWKKHIALLSKTALPGRLLIWKEFYLGVLRSFTQRVGSIAYFKGISGKFSGRYAWMKLCTAMEMLEHCDIPGALAEFRKIEACLPRAPMVCCKYGEVLLCAGRRAAGWRKFDAAVSMAEWKNESTAWKGEMCLMTGEYGRAAEILSGVSATFSGGWLGAAYYKAGRLEPASAALEDAVKKSDRIDYEVKLWLAELRRVTGGFKEAERLLDELLKRKPDYTFARVNRALLFRALGNHGRMRKDFDRVDKALIRAAAPAAGIKDLREMSDAAKGRVLEKILEQAAGNRRPEKYFLNLQFPGCAAATRAGGASRAA